MCSSCSSATDWPSRISGIAAALVVSGTGVYLATGLAAGLACFIDPRSLYRFEHLFAAARVVVVEAVQLHDPVMQVGEADGDRIDVRELVVQRFRNRGDVTPFHTGSGLSDRPRSHD